MPTVTERAAVYASRGAKLLDERKPGWAVRVSLARLKLESTCDCVLGQVYQEIRKYEDYTENLGFENGLNELFGADRYLENIEVFEEDGEIPPFATYGFAFFLRDSNKESSHAKVWAALDEAWSNEIKRRANVANSEAKG